MQRRLHDDKAAAITSVTSTVGASFGAEWSTTSTDTIDGSNITNAGASYANHGSGGSGVTDVTKTDNDDTRTDNLGVNDYIGTEEKASTKKFRWVMGVLVGDSVATLKMEACLGRTSFWNSLLVIFKTAVIRFALAIRNLRNFLHNLPLLKLAWSG